MLLYRGPNATVLRSQYYCMKVSILLYRGHTLYNSIEFRVV